MFHRKLIVEISSQLSELLGKIIRRGLPAIALQRKRPQGICSRSSADAKIDSSRKKPREHAERLCNLERAVVRQHYSARSNANLRRQRCNRPDQRLGTGTSEHRRGMMLCDPMAVVAE